MAALERGVPGPETHGELVGGRQDPLQLGQRAMWYEDPLTARQDAPVRKVAHRQAIRVRGDHPHGVVLGGDQHTGDHAAVLVGTRGPHDLAEGVGEVSRRHGHRLGRRIDLRRVVLDVVVPQGELRTASRDRDVVIPGGHLDGAGRQRLDRIGTEPRRHDHRAIADPTNRGGDANRHVQVGAGDRQFVADQFQMQPLQHGERSGPAGGSPAGSRQRLGEHVSLTSKLHRWRPLTELSYKK